MTSHASRRHLNLEPPTMLSYRATWDDADYEPQFPRRRRRPFARIVAALVPACRRRALGAPQ